MEIAPKQWTCVNCRTFYVDKNDRPLQVDYIDEKYMLVSNYYDQYLVHKHETLINDCYCLACVKQSVLSEYCFEREPEYTFEQNGYTCWDINKLNNYKRECSPCVGCRNIPIMPSLLLNQSKNFMILWSPNLCSLAFHDFDRPKVYTLNKPSKYYLDSNEPSVLCENCFSQESWDKYQGPILCQFCDKTYCRAVNRYDYKPVNYSLSCWTHTNKDDGYVYDGLIDPELYQWVNKPVDYDETKPFCSMCLERFIKDNVIKELSYEECSESDETEEIKELREI